MMIDEAIAKYKEIIDTDASCPRYCMCTCEKCVQESRQIVAWLKELKAIKEKGRYVQGFRAGYKVAIGDFTNRMLEEGVIGLVQFAKIKEIAEQLKEQK